jgi:hypothetical protein
MTKKSSARPKASFTYARVPDELGGEGEYALLLESAVDVYRGAAACRTYGEFATLLGEPWKGFKEDWGDELASSLELNSLTRHTPFSLVHMLASVGAIGGLEDPRCAAYEWFTANVPGSVLAAVQGVEFSDGPLGAIVTGSKAAFHRMQRELREQGYSEVIFRESDGTEWTLIAGEESVA